MLKFMIITYTTRNRENTYGLFSFLGKKKSPLSKNNTDFSYTHIAVYKFRTSATLFTRENLSSVFTARLLFVSFITSGANASAEKHLAKGKTLRYYCVK